MTTRGTPQTAPEKPFEPPPEIPPESSPADSLPGSATPNPPGSPQPAAANPLLPLLRKFASGRWVLTVSCAGVFAYCACTGILEAQATGAILSAVFLSYFNRSDRTPPQS